MSEITLKVQIGSLSVLVTGPKGYAEKKLDELISKYSRDFNPKTPPVETAKAPITNKKTSPSEFIKKANPKNQADIALALAYFLEKQEGKESFTTGDLNEIRSRAKQSAFTNISDTVAKQVKRGYLMGAGDESGARSFVLTTSGEDYVESLIQEPKG